MRAKTGTETSDPIKRTPVCVRCGVQVPSAKQLYTLCLVCIDEEHEALIALSKKVNGAVHDERRRDGRGDRPAADLGPAAGMHFGAQDEVPF